ncbi:MAG: hypothetical protein JXA67_08305 [Micromonosporaceae bacterium]|nr:hypothetical protein [Micromonosporaceae bacterium]
MNGYVGGVAVGDLQPWNTRRVEDYQAMSAAKVSWIRSDLGWKYLQPTPDTWRFSLFDPVVRDVQAAGMRYLAILHTVPSWANGGAGDYGMPANSSLLTTYCYETVKHFVPMGVTEYEIGNEVNLRRPGWTPNGAAYARSYLKPCVTGIRKAEKELGARVTVLFGSQAPVTGTEGMDPNTFLHAAYRNGAAGWFDALAWHPYTGADSPSTSPNLNSVPAQLFKTMQRHGDGKKQIWATEVGQATGGPYSITEEAQASLVTGVFDVWYSKPFAGPLFWYSARDLGDSATDREEHFGLLRSDGSAKPAYTTLQSVLVRSSG